MYNKTLTRRDFLQGAAAAALALPVGSILAQQSDAPADKKTVFRIGALDGVLSGKEGLTWEQDYQRGAKLGFAGIELGVGKDYAQSELWNPEGRKRLRGFAQAAGIETPSICLHSYWHFSFAANDEAVRAQACQLAQEGAIAAQQVGARDILIPFTNPDNVPAETARERWIAGVKKAAPAAEQSGVVFCLENVEVPFADKPEDIIAIVDAIGAPAVQVYYDPGNAVRSGNDPLHAIPLLNKRIAQVHVKEIKGKYIGEGIVPWPQIIQALRDIDYKGWLMLETDATDDAKTAATKNLSTLQSYMG